MSSYRRSKPICLVIRRIYVVFFFTGSNWKSGQRESNTVPNSSAKPAPTRRLKSCLLTSGLCGKLVEAVYAFRDRKDISAIHVSHYKSELPVSDLQLW